MLKPIIAAAALLVLPYPGRAQQLGASHPYASHQKLSLKSLAAGPLPAPLYQRIEIPLDLHATYDNPFDPDDIDVWASFRSPSGKTLRVNGFLDQPFARRGDGNREAIIPVGPPAWKIRFTPTQPGIWSYQIFARDRTGTLNLPAAKLTVAKSARPGFIGRSKRNPAVFAYANERPYFAVGENLCWGEQDGRRGLQDYETWLAALGKARANWIRVWMSSWNCALEWTPEPKYAVGAYYGVGVYNLANAWKLDALFDLADRQGMSLMLCLGTYGEFNEGGYFGEGQWKANPYNAANGGPCAKAADFWTNPAARKFYQRRLRYLAARYGCRTNLQSWEFWNEANAPAGWVAEMARCLKGTREFAPSPADPYGHLVTTTYGNPEVWAIPEIDFTQTHKYGTGNIPDFAPAVHDEAIQSAKFGKPHLMAEFGIDWRKGDQDYDRDGQGVNFHNALWSAALSGDAGSAMIWWWDGYVQPKNLYPHLAALRNFVDRVPWTAGAWRPANVAEAGSAHRLNTYGLALGRSAILWLQNAEHHWKNVSEGKPFPAVEPAIVELRGLPDGSYSVEWWDTYSGQVTGRTNATCSGEVLRLRPPSVSKDLAARITPAGRTTVHK